MNTQFRKENLLSVPPDSISSPWICVVILAGSVMILAAPSAVNAEVTGFAGGGQSHYNIQPSAAVNYIIATQGIFPSRNLTGGDGSGSNIGTLGVEPFIGEVSMFGGNFAPRGWALANGQLLQIDDNQTLYSILGTKYGGNGRTTFALPDLRGRMPIGPRTGPGLSTRTVGQTGGEEFVTLTTGELASHHHHLPAPVNGTLNTGGGSGHENMQPFLGLNPIVVTQGRFPSRSLTEAGDGSTTTLVGDEYLGAITYFAGDFAPRGSLFADGQLLPIAQNTALFSLYGTRFGGDGRTTFALPDLRGRTPIGARIGPGLTQWTLGERPGREEVHLTPLELGPHTHTAPLPSSLTTGNTGQGLPHENMAPSFVLNYIIALQGTFPSRSLTDGGDGGGLELAGGNPLIGEIGLFGGDFAPRGWAFADGQLLQVAEYSALFSILGTTYGGNGRTTFALPDLRGRAAVSSGHGPGLSDWRLGSRSGAETVSLSWGEMPSHNHSIFPGPSVFGDFDGDWDIDRFDYNIFLGQFGMRAAPGALASDLDKDGDVDLADFRILRDAFGFGVPSPAAAPAASATPEPMSMAILVVGGLAVLPRRKRSGDCGVR